MIFCQSLMNACHKGSSSLPVQVRDRPVAQSGSSNWRCGRAERLLVLGSYFEPESPGSSRAVISSGLAPD